ncbi:MAG TPA: DedA family protein [Dehalococcoidia bacterium]|nr:DedA family protein [Dehalococcoidia bacterium]
MELTPLAPIISAGSAIQDAIQWLIDLPAAIFRAYSSLLEWAADSVRELFDDYGYWVVFLGTLFENTLLLGLLVPGVIIVLLAGITAQDGAMNPFYAAALGIAGTVIGDTISYLMGRLGWARFGNGDSLRTFSERVREPLLRRGVFFVLVYHFAGYTRVVGPAGAGLLRMPYRKWAPADHIGAVLWVSTFIGIGYLLGMAGIKLDSTDRYFRYVEWGILALIALWGILVFRTSHAAIMARIESVLGEDERDADTDAGEGGPEPEVAVTAARD